MNDFDALGAALLAAATRGNASFPIMAQPEPQAPAAPKPAVPESLASPRNAPEPIASKLSSDDLEAASLRAEMAKMKKSLAKMAKKAVKKAAKRGF